MVSMGALTVNHHHHKSLWSFASPKEAKNNYHKDERRKCEVKRSAEVRHQKDITLN